MDIIIEELPVEIIDLFERVTKQDNPSLDVFEMFIVEFRSYLIEEVLQGVDDRYIDKTILFNDIFDIYMKFKENKETVENEWWNRLLYNHQKRSQVYDHIFDKIIEKEEEKGDKLTEDELFEIENGFREELFASHRETILKNRIYDSMNSYIFFSDNPFVGEIHVYYDRVFFKKRDQFSSFEYRGRSFEIFKDTLEVDLLECVDSPEQGLCRLPVDWYPQNNPNKPRRCLIFKKGDYLEDFDVDLSLVDLRRINVRKIENINYVLLFLKKYAARMDDDYLYRLNFEILKLKLDTPNQSLQKNYQLFKKLRKIESLDFPLNLFKEKIEEFLIKKVIDSKVQLSSFYLCEILESIQEELRVKLHPQTYLAYYTQAEAWTIQHYKEVDLDKECPKIIKNKFDEELWDEMVNLIDENEHLLVVKPRERIGETNYNRWKALETDKLSLLNVKTFGLYGVENEDFIYRNAHGAEICEFEFEHYQSINLRLSCGIFPKYYPHYFSGQEMKQAYRNLFGPHEFCVVRYAVDDFLHVKAKNVISNSRYMLNAFLTAEEFKEQYQKLLVIEKHLNQMGDLNSAKVEDYYIDWKGLGF